MPLRSRAVRRERFEKPGLWLQDDPRSPTCARDSPHESAFRGKSKGHFAGFDCKPYLASFQLPGTPLSAQLINVHWFQASAARRDIERRALETTSVDKWADLRHKSRYLRVREVIALADFNMPKPTKDAATWPTTR